MTEMCKVKQKGLHWVTQNEVLSLRQGAKLTRNAVRNELIVLMLYRHGFRETELCNLRVDYINVDEAKLFIKRLKGSNDCNQPIKGDELRLIKRHLAIRAKKSSRHLPWLFISEQGNQLSRFTVIKAIATCANLAKLRKITPHMLRHGCGYYLANKGIDVRVIQDYLGHKKIQNTVLYTRLSGKRFERLWD